MFPKIRLTICLFLLALSALPGSRPVLAHEEHEHLHVLIDIKPGSDPNAINLKNNGLVPVALFGSEELAVQNVDTSSVRLAREHHHESGAQAIKVASQDVNQDGILDLVYFFATGDLRAVLERDDTAACLHGSLLDNTHFCGHDPVRIIP